nr:cytochrome P450 CYP82D47-like [Ipomoea batatas]
MAAEIMGYNYSMVAIAPYGEYWRGIRKTVMLELLSTRRLEMLRKVRESHVRKAVKRTFDHLVTQQGSNFWGGGSGDEAMVFEMDGLGRVREGYEEETVEEMDCAADRWLKEHRTKRNLKSKEEEDFMDAMLSLFDASSNQTHPLGLDNDVIIKSTCLILHLTLASLIQSFDMKRPSIEPIDMTQSPGLTSPKATPLHVLLIPRLASDLYG